MSFISEKYEHLKPQNRVYNDRAQRLLKANHYVAIIQATGTGKSYQAYQLIHDMCAEKWTGSNKIKLLIVAPTEPLVNDWDEHLRDGGGFSKDLQSEMKEAAVKNGTVSYSLKSGNIGYSYTIITYTNLKNIAGVTSDDVKLTSEQEKKIVDFTDRFNLIIFDEVHHAGAKTYAPVIEKIIGSASGNKYVVGMTATEDRTDGIKVTKFFGGSVVHGMTRKQAQTGDYEVYAKDGSIKSGGNERVLPNCKVYLSLVYDERLSTCRALKKLYMDWVGGLSNIKDKQEYSQLIEIIFGNLSVEAYSKFVKTKLLNKKPQKLICFYQQGENVSNVKAFIRDVFGIDNIVDIHANYSSKDNEEALNMFKSSTQDIVILSIDKLNEGLHVGGVTGIIMIRKTFSPVIFNQQLGRAMDYGNRNLTIPVFDIVGNSAIQADIVDGDPDDLRNFAEEMKGSEEFAPNFKQAMGMLKNVENYLLSMGVKKPKMASKADLKKVIQSMVGSFNTYLDALNRFTLKEVEFIYGELFKKKRERTPDYPYDISMFEDSDFRRALLYTGVGASKDYPLIYYITQEYVRRQGRFKDRQELADFWNSHFGLNKDVSKDQVEKALSNSYYNSFVSTNESVFSRTNTYLDSLKEKLNW